MLADSKAHGKALKKRDAFFKECIMFPDPLGLAQFHKTPNPALSFLQIEPRPALCSNRRGNESKKGAVLQSQFSPRCCHGERVETL